MRAAQGAAREHLPQHLYHFTKVQLWVGHRGVLKVSLVILGRLLDPIQVFPPRPLPKLRRQVYKKGDQKRDYRERIQNLHIALLYWL